MHKVRPIQQCVPLFDVDSSMEFFDPSLDEAKKSAKGKNRFQIKNSNSIAAEKKKQKLRTSNSYNNSNSNNNKHTKWRGENLQVKKMLN